MAAVLLPQRRADLGRGKEEGVVLIRAVGGAAARAVQAGGRDQLAQAEVERFLGRVAVEGHVPALPRLGIKEGEDGVVVEAFFKAGAQPFAVKACGEEAAADVVVHAAAPQAAQVLLGHDAPFRLTGKVSAAQQKQQRARPTAHVEVPFAHPLDAGERPLAPGQVLIHTMLRIEIQTVL